MSKVPAGASPETDPEKQRADALAQIDRAASSYQKLDRLNLLRYALPFGGALLASRVYILVSTRAPSWGAVAIFIGVFSALLVLVLRQNRIDAKRSAKQIEIMRAYVEKTYNLQTGKEKGWSMHVCRVPGAKRSGD